MLCFSWECLHNPWLKWTLTPKFIFSGSSPMTWFSSCSTTASLSQAHCSQWISISAAGLGAGLGLKDLMEQILKSKGKDLSLGLFWVRLQKTKLGLCRRGWMWPEKELKSKREDLSMCLFQVRLKNPKLALPRRGWGWVGGQRRNTLQSKSKMINWIRMGEWSLSGGVGGKNGLIFLPVWAYSIEYSNSISPCSSSTFSIKIFETPCNKEGVVLTLAALRNHKVHLCLLKPLPTKVCHKYLLRSSFFALSCEVQPILSSLPAPRAEPWSSSSSSSSAPLLRHFRETRGALRALHPQIHQCLVLCWRFWNRR